MDKKGGILKQVSDRVENFFMLPAASENATLRNWKNRALPHDTTNEISGMLGAIHMDDGTIWNHPSE